METPLVVGKRLKTIRTEKQLSLDEVSRLTDVSKPMLGQIERGQSSPTITTLWKIAVGLKIPLSSLLEEEDKECTVVDIQSKEAIVEENGTMRAYPIFSFDPNRNIEIYYIELVAGCHHTAKAHSGGVEEYVFVIQGCIEMVIDDKKIILHENQTLRFQADVIHAYNNPYSSPCVIYNMVFYPKA
jgi:Predicted transcriptional regulators